MQYKDKQINSDKIKYESSALAVNTELLLFGLLSLFAAAVDTRLYLNNFKFRRLETATE